MTRQTTHNLEQVLDAITNSQGVIETIATRLGVARSTVYRYMENWKSVEQAIKDEREGMKDYAESKLFKLIRADNLTAIIFYLKTQGRDRGYIETLRLEGQIQVNLVNETIKALEDAGVDAQEFFQKAIDRANAHKVLQNSSKE